MLEKENIKLRAIEPEDVEFIINMENDSRLWQVSSTYNPFSRFDIEQYTLLADKDIYSAKQVRFMIDKILPEIESIGAIDVFDFDAHHKRAGIGIFIVESERGNGYAGIVLDILIEYLFTHINLHQIFCNIGSDNSNSIKLFESKGFIQSGVKKDWNLIGNKWTDELFYQLVKTNQ